MNAFSFSKQDFNFCCPVNANQHSFFENKSRHFEKYMHGMELKLTGCVGIVIFLLQTKKQTNPVIFLCSELFWQNSEFSPICCEKIPIFDFARDIERHNFVTPWPILVIEVSMVRRDQHLSIDTKAKIMKTMVAKIQGALQPRLDVLHKIRWLNEG